MTWTAVAVIGGAVIGAVGSTVAGNEAANATQNAANTAANVQLQALQQQKQLAAPYTGLGQSAIPMLQQLLGIGPQGPGGIMQTLQNTPGYQFAKQQGTQGIQNASTLNAGPLSTGTLQQLDTFNTGLASGTYQQVLGDVFNTVGLGQAAAAGQAANIGNAASNLSNIAQTQGTNLANIDINQIAGITKAFGNAGNQYTTLAALGALNNPSTPAGSNYPNSVNNYGQGFGSTTPVVEGG